MSVIFENVITAGQNEVAQADPSDTTFDVHNDSPLKVKLRFGSNNPREVVIGPGGYLYGFQPGYGRRMTVGGSFDGRVEIVPTLPGGGIGVANAPASELTIVSYIGQADHVAGSMTRSANIGSQVSTTASQTVINDTAALGTPIVEYSVGGTTYGLFKNDGTVQLWAISNNVATKLFDITPGDSTHAASMVVGSSSNGVTTMLHGTADSASSVPAAGVAAGTLGAGVVVPAANVSGKVASASSADSATNATTVGDNANGVVLAVGDGGGRMNIKPASTGTTGRGFLLQTRDSGGVLHTVAQADADGTNAAYHGVADSASSVPAAGVAAGTLGAGVVVPAANISGKVASASSADSATNATTSGDGASGSFLSAQDGGATINIKPTVGPRGITLSTRDAGGVLHSLVSANADASSVALHGVADSASSVPAAGVAAGTLGAGVVVPGGNVTGAVASATSATSATNNQDGNPAIGAKSAGGGTAGRTEWRGTTDPAASAAEGDSWDAV